MIALPMQIKILSTILCLLSGGGSRIVSVSCYSPQSRNSAFNSHSQRSKNSGIIKSRLSLGLASAASSDIDANGEGKRHARQMEDGSQAETSSTLMDKTSDNKDQDEDAHALDMPWSEVQKWALKENLAKYTVMISLKKGGSEITEIYGLWRTMAIEVDELAGYPIDFLQRKHVELRRNGESSLQETPKRLPYLDGYEFTSLGGVKGKVFGIPGLQDGTKIETASVDSIQTTLPKGFIRCSDGSAAYELGTPWREEFSSKAAFSKEGEVLLNKVESSGSKVAPIASDAAKLLQDEDELLVRLGATTGILLAGATAINMLSHHLTVNVFWV